MACKNAMSHPSDTQSRWTLEMRKNGLVRPGERVGVAVSGGPDSMLLLEFMRSLARDMGLSLTVVHFNHHLRGAESDRDEAFVRERARMLGLEFLRGESDVARVAREKHRNLEATARELRYRFFFSLVNRGKLDKVATAHSANDQAETVLLRLLRGAGARGLGGLFPVLEGKVVRPFLHLTRAEIEREIHRRKLDFRVDSSNLDPRFLRNRVRFELLPILAREFNPQIIVLLADLAERARDEESYLEQQAFDRARPWRVRDGGNEKIPTRPLAEFPKAIARRVLRQMIGFASGHLRGVTHGHVESLLRFAQEAQSGRTLVLPGGLVARKEFDWLAIGPRVQGTACLGFSYNVQVPGEVPVPERGVVLTFEILDFPKQARAYNNLGEEYLDPDKLSGRLVLRNWRAGDRFQPSGSQRARKIKELFSRKKVPLSQRHLWPVLECGGEIVWVLGFPPASRWVVSRSSRRFVLIGEVPWRGEGELGGSPFGGG